MSYGFGFGYKFGRGSSGINYDADALAVFAVVTDVPTNIKSAINTLIVSHKNANKWTELKTAIVSIPTMTHANAFIDLKTATVLATPSGSSPSSESLCIAYPIGYYFREGSSDYINSGVNDNALGMTVNSFSIASGEVINRAAGAKFNYGVVQGAAQRRLTNLRNATAKAATLGYDAGSTVAANTDVRGRWFVNRNAADYLELVKDNAILATDLTSAASTVPTINGFIGCYNNSGTPTSYSDGISDYYAQYIGQSTTDRSTLDGFWNTFRTDMGRATPTRQLILDGNSLTKRNFDRMFRKAMFSLSNNNKSYNNVIVKNYGVPGQATTAMTADFTAQITPNYNAAFSINDYIAWEITNDLWSGTTAAQAKINFIALVVAAEAVGFTVNAIQPIARNYLGNTGGRTETQWNLALDELVQWVRAGSSGAVRFTSITDTNLWLNRSDYASDALYNTAIATITNNATYYTDGTHLTDAGYDIVGTALYDSLITYV